MKRKLLYYPYIDIPNLSFVKKAILYWDKISSIVPYEYDYKCHLNPHIQYLKDEGEYEPISTANLYFSCDTWENTETIRQNFNKELIKILSSIQIKKSEKFSRLHKEKLREYKVHKNKIVGFEDEIYLFLKDRGFLIKEDLEWMYLPEDIADIIMAILAKYLAICDKDYTVPATDKEKYENIAFNIKTKEHFLTNKSLALNLFLKKLPVPRDDVSLQEIIQFKRKRCAELLEFRNFISSFQNRLVEAKTTEEIKKVLVDFNEKVNRKKQEIEKLLKDAKINYTVTIVKSLIPLGMFIIGIMDNINRFIESVALISFVKIGIDFLDVFTKFKKQKERHEFAYLYYAKKENII